MRRLLALLVLPGCVVQYAVGAGTGTDTGTGTEGVTGDVSSGTCPTDQVSGDTCGGCPDGQVLCDEQCVVGAACGEGCGDGEVLCDGVCVAAGACACTGCDAVLEQCVADECVCRDGLVRCGEACLDVRTDRAHCGGCEDPCGDAEVCRTGTCQAACKDGQTACDGACVDLKTDSLHCGKCATVCQLDEVCLAGECRVYMPVAGCDACPCDADCGQQVCCASPFLGAPVCVDESCGGDG